MVLRAEMGIYACILELWVKRKIVVEDMAQVPGELLTLAYKGNRLEHRVV